MQTRRTWKKRRSEIGTVATTNLSLIKPDTSEEIRKNLPTFAGWAQQNSDNCDKIDSLFRGNTGTWSPTWTASANPTLGTGGFVEGKYVRLMPRMVVCFFRIYTGTTGFAAGTGSYNISVPFSFATELTGISNELAIGKAYFYDNSAVATSNAFTVMYTNTPDRVFLKTPINDLWSSTSPVVPAQDDRINGYFMYPTSAA